jgi:glycosyltransferase involved in cell wall biosynthesis
MASTGRHEREGKWMPERDSNFEPDLSGRTRSERRLAGVGSSISLGRTSDVRTAHPAPVATAPSGANAVAAPTPAEMAPSRHELPTACLRVALIYDMDACHGPTGVTRHALAQLERLASRPGIALALVSGRIGHPDGLAYWKGLELERRCQLPLRTRDILRWWRLAAWPPIEWWTGALDWVYSPAEYFVATGRARRAVTSHDILQALQFGPTRRRDILRRVFERADLILSVSHFNTQRLIEAFPTCRDRVAYVPNGADDLFFETATDQERARVRDDLGLPPQVPYLLSVANFQPRKNLRRLINAVAALPEVSAGDLALVLIGTGQEDEIRVLRDASAQAGRRALIRMPGYRQGRALRAVYSEATALVFPSLCESFGIPAVEAMAQGVPVVLANSTALPEVGGEAGWYFEPTDTSAMAAAVREMLDNSQERARRLALGRTIAAQYRWHRANDLLVAALLGHREPFSGSA